MIYKLQKERLGWGGGEESSCGGERERETERQMRTNHAKMRHDLLLYSSPGVFSWMPPEQGCSVTPVVCVLMHKFRSSTKP